jgi:hypothetical protein
MISTFKESRPTELQLPKVNIIGVNAVNITVFIYGYTPPVQVIKPDKTSYHTPAKIQCVFLNNVSIPFKEDVKARNEPTTKREKIMVELNTENGLSKLSTGNNEIVVANSADYKSYTDALFSVKSMNFMPGESTFVTKWHTDGNSIIQAPVIGGFYTLVDMYWKDNLYNSNGVWKNRPVIWCSRFTANKGPQLPKINSFFETLSESDIYREDKTEMSNKANLKNGGWSFVRVDVHPYSFQKTFATENVEEKSTTDHSSDLALISKNNDNENRDVVLRGLFVAPDPMDTTMYLHKHPNGDQVAYTGGYVGQKNLDKQFMLYQTQIDGSVLKVLGHTVLYPETIIRFQVDWKLLGPVMVSFLVASAYCIVNPIKTPNCPYKSLEENDESSDAQIFEASVHLKTSLHPDLRAMVQHLGFKISYQDYMKHFNKTRRNCTTIEALHWCNAVNIHRYHNTKDDVSLGLLVDGKEANNENDAVVNVLDLFLICNVTEAYRRVFEGSEKTCEEKLKMALDPLCYPTSVMEFAVFAITVNPEKNIKDYFWSLSKN